MSRFGICRMRASNNPSFSLYKIPFCNFSVLGCPDSCPFISLLGFQGGESLRDNRGLQCSSSCMARASADLVNRSFNLNPYRAGH